ncbi:MAG: Smr/MutS family protein [Spirochaetaceae bacterium]|jgi:DNA-nicking Smr family endonuclease|nr:Smr/MutS family protein [Spirochaetaceae bacterium]
MDFGKILDRWDKKSGGIYDKDAALETRGESPASRRRRLLRKKPDGILDLHGLTRDEAWNALSGFFRMAKDRGLEKLLIIHGKGIRGGDPGENSPPAGVRERGILAKTVHEFLERCPLAGERGYSSASQGGTGSTWVLLKIGG